MPAGYRTWLRRTRHVIKTRIDHHPSLYLFLSRIRPGTRALVVSSDTEIVIEGFPRSANTFAVAAFTLAQGRPVKIARHLHAPAQVIAGVRMHIPTLVLIRHPRDAVLSLVVRAPHLSVEQALKDYIHFYTVLLPYLGQFVIGLFEQVTTDFGRVIAQINEHYGTNFRLFEHTEENLRRVFAMVEQMDRENTGRPVVQEATVARPSSIRMKWKQALAHALTSSKIQPLLHEAEHLHQRFTTFALRSTKA